jgi:hypothetical protein
MAERTRILEEIRRQLLFRAVLRAKLAGNTVVWTVEAQDHGFVDLQALVLYYSKELHDSMNLDFNRNREFNHVIVDSVACGSRRFFEM